MKVFDAFANAGVAVDSAIYRDDFHDEVLQQLLLMHACWSDTTRSKADATAVNSTRCCAKWPRTESSSARIRTRS